MTKIDLHIHSSESQYKENDWIVKSSTADNIDVLLSKLDEYGVNLFSITDHNRFNTSLYLVIDEMMSMPDFKYKSIKGLVAGVEFDVLIEEGMHKCHIICIFDADNKKENYDKIHDAIEKDKLSVPEDYYSKERFEYILKDIGLSVILIACQRSSLNIASEKHNSLSESTSDPWTLIGSGYISALEFQKPNVEGILKSNLKEANIDSGLVMGSDCHEWSAYPMHDSKTTPVAFFHTEAKILPTFKGLLMGFSSPKTRFGTETNHNTDYIKDIRINGETINLVNGLNVIVGENGSGKSSILRIINGDEKLAYIKKIKKDNSITCDSIETDKIRYIGQGDIVKKFSDNSLFPDEYYDNVNVDEFRIAYGKFSQDLYDFILHNIDVHQSLSTLKDLTLDYFEDNGKNYFIRVDSFKTNRTTANEHQEKCEELSIVLEKVRSIRRDKYFKEFDDELKVIESRLQKIHRTISERSNKIQRESFVRNNIVSAINTYKTKIKQESTSVDRIRQDNQERRTKFLNRIAETIIRQSHPQTYPNIPDVIDGQSSKTSNGFSFNCEAAYNNKPVIDDFYSKMFTKDYRNTESISNISSKDEFKKAIRNCTSIDGIKENYDKNYTLFIDEMTKCRHYIVDGTKNNLGNTLGEMSLAYFKYIVFNDDRTIYLIDQPEDHISNLNISKKLIQYFNSIRYQKQLVIVTHNPLLVVNQDADNVIFVSKKNDLIEVKSGSLEYENDNYSILDLIAEHMDGGMDSIKRRLKVYE